MNIQTFATTLLLTSTLFLGVAAAEGEYSCDNYGFQTQVNVTGDNNNNCTIQHCEAGPTGAGAAGVGVGTAAGEGEGSAEASAGTSCDQSSGSDPSPGGKGLGKLVESVANLHFVDDREAQ